MDRIPVVGGGFGFRANSVTAAWQVNTSPGSAKQAGWMWPNRLPSNAGPNRINKVRKRMGALSAKG